MNPRTDGDAPLPPESRPLYVMAAEDNPHDRRILARAWKRLDSRHELELVDDGFECLERLLGLREAPEIEVRVPDILVLDVSMPKIDGLDVLREIRSNGRLAKMHIVVVTGHTASHLADRDGAFEWDCMIEKSTDFEEFVRRLGECLQSFCDGLGPEAVR